MHCESNVHLKCKLNAALFGTAAFKKKKSK